MFSWPEQPLLALGAALFIAGMCTTSALAQNNPYPGIGRAATPKEVAAWDTDVRADFKGLPQGQGSVAQGQRIWEAQCASCHGYFGESNEVFMPLVGGTTAADVKTGRVARLTDPAYPGRTTLMKLPTLSTLWDYIYRAMPWNAPKSLSADEVYAVTAFLLNLGGVVPDDYTLSHSNMAQTQARLPNRNGMRLDHGLWPGKPGELGMGTDLGKSSKPDVQAVACMSRCATEPSVASFLPGFARNSHGNLFDQNRVVGAQRGAATDRAAAFADAPPTASPPSSPQDLAKKHQCLTCHALDSKVVGPSLREVAKKYAMRPDVVDYLKKQIVAGGSGQWGPIAMPAQTLPSADALSIAKWLAEGAP